MRIVIIGGGFGGVYCAKFLEKLAKKYAKEVDILLVSKENFFLFTPMLPQVISRSVEAERLVISLRHLLPNTRFCKGSVEFIDTANRKVIIRSGIEDETNEFSVNYDHLVIALGSETNFMNMPHLKDVVFLFKNISDAMILRNHVIDMLEEADIESDKDRRKQLLTFVIVGGGLSGIEIAAELSGFLSDAIKYYPNIKRDEVNVIVVHSRERILPEIDKDLAEFAQKQLGKVSIMLNSRAINVNKDLIEIASGNKSRLIYTKSIIWTAGISPNPLIAKMSCEKCNGRLVTDEFLRVKGTSNIWAVGDSAYIINKRTNEPYPSTAQHATREAEVAAYNIMASIFDYELKPFEYNTKAQMAVVGKYSAIADLFGFKLYGFSAWLLWRIIYLRKLPSMKKRLGILFDWLTDLFFDTDLIRIGEREERKVSDIMSKNVISIESYKSVSEAASVMSNEGVGSLFVTENGKVSGIISERDIVRKVVAKGIDPERIIIQSIMTRDLVMIEPDVNIHYASNLMSMKGIRRLPVIENGNLVGIVTSTDLARYLGNRKLSNKK